jgi:hypothetical protein
MPFPKTPAPEDQIVLCDLGQRSFKSAARRRRKNDIIKTSARRDGFDRAAASNAKKTREWNRRHSLHPTVLVGQKSMRPDLAGTTLCNRFRPTLAMRDALTSVDEGGTHSLRNGVSGSSVQEVRIGEGVELSVHETYQ